MSDIGSPKKLNWVEHKLYERTHKAIPHDERVDAYYRNGTPPTRSGMVHGHKSNLIPAMPSALNPPLQLDKALLAPNKTGPDGAKESSHKRDPHGRFSQTQATGPQSAAAQDLAEQRRQAFAARSKVTTKGLEGLGQQPQGTVPTASTAIDPQAEGRVSALGMTQSGMPVYEDPYHSDHGKFSATDHQDAANIHADEATSAKMSGDTNDSMMHEQKANVHRELAGDSQSPMERLIAQYGGNQSAQMPSSQGQAPQQQMQPQAPNQQQKPSSAQGVPADFRQMSKASPNTAYGKEDPMDNLLKPQGMPDQNKPMMWPPSWPGPKPAMFDTRTGMSVGPQTMVGRPASAYSMSPTGVPVDSPMNAPAGPSISPNAAGPANTPAADGRTFAPPAQGPFVDAQADTDPQQGTEIPFDQMLGMLGDKNAGDDPAAPTNADGAGYPPPPQPGAESSPKHTLPNKGEDSEDKDAPPDALKSLARWLRGR